MKSLKQVISILTAVAKAKSVAVKSKTSAIKTRLMLFRLLHDKKLLTGVLPQNVHAVKKLQDYYNKDVVSYKPTRVQSMKCLEEDEDEECPYVTNLFLDSDLEVGDGNEYDMCSRSVMDLISSEGDGSDFIHENEIDIAADVFIKRFYMQMQSQNRSPSRDTEKY